MALSVNDLLAVQQTASGLFKEEIERLTTLREETDQKIKDLGGLEDIAGLLSHAEEAMAAARDKTAQAEAYAKRVTAEAEAARQGASSLKAQADSLLAEATSKHQELDRATKLLNEERTVFAADRAAKQNELKALEGGLRGRAIALGEAEEHLRQKVAKIREIVGA